LDKLARVLGVYHEPPAAQSTVTVQQMNIGGGENALEAIRRLAFALAKAQQLQSFGELRIEGSAVSAGVKE
jgi:hypothetical protein